MEGGLMPVVKVQNGKVVQLWRDVNTVAQAVAKYGQQDGLFRGNHPPGTLRVAGKFKAPPPPVPVVEESAAVMAIRRLAQDASPETLADVNLILKG
jgi:hypothetical protein